MGNAFWFWRKRRKHSPDNAGPAITSVEMLTGLTEEEKWQVVDREIARLRADTMLPDDVQRILQGQNRPESDKTNQHGNRRT